MSEPGASSSVLPPPPLPLRVTLQFTYTPEDLIEGCGARPKAHKPSKNVKFFGWIVWGMALAFFVLLTRQARQMPTPNPSGDKTVVLIDPWVTLAPSALSAIVVGTLFAALVLSERRNAKLSPPQRAASANRAIRVALVICAASVIAAVFILADASPPTWQPSHFLLTLLSFAPWFLVLVALILWGTRAARRAVRTAFEKRPGFRRERTVELNSSGITTDDGMMHSHSKWQRYDRALETANTFALRDENGETTVLPKRAMVDRPDIILTVRALLNNGIADCEFLVQPTGFEVTPIPAIPLSESSSFSRPVV